MGSIYLGSLPDVLRRAGLDVDVYPGWETRSRGSGGYDALFGIQVHHTASSGTSPANDMKYMWENATTKPIGACYIAPNGKWTVGAAGATNTSGRGGPMVTSRGTVPLDAGNRYLISLEAANRGDGTPWPTAQQSSLVIGTAALNRAYFGGALNHPGDVNAHFEWTSRKVDPAGQSRYATGANKWNMTLFRSDVAHLTAPPPPPPTSGEVNMIVLDHKPGTPEWTALCYTGSQLSHITTGHADLVLRDSGVIRKPVTDAALDAFIASSETTTVCPGTFTGARRDLWNRQRAATRSDIQELLTAIQQ